MSHTFKSLSSPPGPTGEVHSEAPHSLNGQQGATLLAAIISLIVEKITHKYSYVLKTVIIGLVGKKTLVWGFFFNVNHKLCLEGSRLLN